MDQKRGKWQALVKVVKELEFQRVPIVSLQDEKIHAYQEGFCFMELVN